jgi:hypothetical protein
MAADPIAPSITREIRAVEIWDTSLSPPVRANPVAAAAVAANDARAPYATREIVPAELWDTSQNPPLRFIR